MNIQKQAIITYRKHTVKDDEARNMENAMHFKLLYKNTSTFLKEVSAAMLNTCDKNCAGDSTNGIPPCPLYEAPDVNNTTGIVIPGGCKISNY